MTILCFVTPSPQAAGAFQFQPCSGKAFAAGHCFEETALILRLPSFFGILSKSVKVRTYSLSPKSGDQNNRRMFAYTILGGATLAGIFCVMEFVGSQTIPVSISAYGTVLVAMLSGVFINGIFSAAMPDVPFENINNWRDPLRAAAESLLSKHGIQLADDLREVFEAADIQAKSRRYVVKNEGPWRNVHFLLVSELLAALTLPAHHPKAMRSEGGMDYQIFVNRDVSFDSSLGPVSASFILRMDAERPYLLLSMRLRGAHHHIFPNLRFGTDYVDDFLHQWPHLDISRPNDPEKTDVHHIDLFPSVDKSGDGQKRVVERMFQTLQKLKKVLSKRQASPETGSAHSGFAVLSEWEHVEETVATGPEAAPVIKEVTTEVPVNVGSKNKPPIVIPMLTPRQIQDFKAALAKATKTRPERFSRESKEAFLDVLRLPDISAESLNAHLKKITPPFRSAEIDAVTRVINATRLALQTKPSELKTTSLQRDPAPQGGLLRISLINHQDLKNLGILQAQSTQLERRGHRPLVVFENPGPGMEMMEEWAKLFSTTWEKAVHDPAHIPELQNYFEKWKRDWIMGQETFNRKRERMRAPQFYLQSDAARFRSTDSRVLAVAPTMDIILEKPSFTSWLVMMQSLSDLDTAFHALRGGDINRYLFHRRRYLHLLRTSLNEREEHLTFQLAPYLTNHRDVLISMMPNFQLALGERLARQGSIVQISGQIPPEMDSLAMSLLRDSSLDFGKASSGTELAMMQLKISDMYGRWFDLPATQRHFRAKMAALLWRRPAFERWAAKYASTPKGSDYSDDLLRYSLASVLAETAQGLSRGEADELGIRIAERLAVDDLVRSLGFFWWTEWSDDISHVRTLFKEWLRDQEEAGAGWLLPEEKQYFPPNTPQVLRSPWWITLLAIAAAVWFWHLRAGASSTEWASMAFPISPRVFHRVTSWITRSAKADDNRYNLAVRRSLQQLWRAA
jgi:hypothetical protein